MSEYVVTSVRVDKKCVVEVQTNFSRPYVTIAGPTVDVALYIHDATTALRLLAAVAAVATAFTEARRNSPVELDDLAGGALDPDVSA